MRVECSHCILIPQGSNESSIFWCQMKAYIFSLQPHNFSNSLTLEVIVMYLFPVYQITT